MTAMKRSAAFDQWQVLTGRALDDCHPGWIRGADAALLAALRSSPLGRRQLARELARRAAPALMSLTAVEIVPTLPQCDWMQETGEVLRSRVADLGVMALAPGIRKMVGRQAVHDLREMMGTRRYDWLLASDPSEEERITDVRQLKGWRLVDRCLGDHAAFVSLIERRGLHEIGGPLTGAPPLLCERMALLFAPGARSGAADPWLPPGRALRLMREGGSGDAYPQARIESRVTAQAV